MRRCAVIQRIFRNTVFYGWIIVGSTFVISVIGMGARYSFGVFLKSIEADFGISRGMTSGIFSVYMLLSSLFAVLGGWGMDRYGPRRVGLLMGAFTGASLLLTSRANAPWQLLITFSLLLAVGTGPTYSIANTTAARWFARKRGLALGISSSGGGMGAIVFAPFAAYLISGFNWQTAYVVLGLVSSICLGAASLLLIKDPRDMGLLPDGGKAELGGGEVPEKGKDSRPTGVSLNQAVGMSQFYLLGLNWVFSSLSLHMVFVHVVPYAVDRGASPVDAAFIISLIGFANIPGRVVTGRISDSGGRKALAIACPLIQVCTLLWLMWARQLWAFYSFAIVFGFMWGGGGTMILALISDIFGTRNLGPIMGIMSAGWALGAAIGPAVGGYMFDASGRYFTAFCAGAVALLIAASMIVFLRRPDPAAILELMD